MALEGGLQLFDAHCHLQDEQLDPESIPGLLQEAAAAGVARLALNGCWPEDWGRVAALCAAHPQALIPNFGLHPWWAGRRSDDWLEQLREWLLAAPHAGLGECGLDKLHQGEGAGIEVQQQLFEQQLALAQELRRPVSVHCVKAYGQVLAALQRLSVELPIVLHSWGGSLDMVHSLLRLPVAKPYFSLSGHLLRLPPHKAMPMVRAIPLDRLLLESDAPDGPPQLSDAWLAALPPHCRQLPQQLERFQPLNAPAAVRQLLTIVAAVVGRSEAAVAAATCANAEYVFLRISSRQAGWA